MGRPRTESPHKRSGVGSDSGREKRGCKRWMRFLRRSCIPMQPSFVIWTAVILNGGQLYTPPSLKEGIVCIRAREGRDLKQ